MTPGLGIHTGFSEWQFLLLYGHPVQQRGALEASRAAECPDWPPTRLTPWPELAGTSR